MSTVAMRTTRNRFADDEHDPRVSAVSENKTRRTTTCVRVCGRVVWWVGVRRKWKGKGGSWGDELTIVLISCLSSHNPMKTVTISVIDDVILKERIALH